MNSYICPIQCPMSDPPPLPCPEHSKGEGNCMGVDVGRYLIISLPYDI